MGQQEAAPNEAILQTSFQDYRLVERVINATIENNSNLLTAQLHRKLSGFDPRLSQRGADHSPFSGTK